LKVLKLRKEVLGERHPDTIGSMADLAATYHQQGRSKEAEDIYMEVLALRKEVLGERHPDTIESMANLAATYRQQGRSKEAEEIDLEVLALRKEVLGERHPGTIMSFANEEDAESSSGAESVLSMAASASSRSSITGEVGILARKEFAKLLLDDEKLKSLFVLAIESDKIGAERFERNFRRLLNQFSVGLQQEARIKEQNDAVYFIHSQSRFVARYICSSIAPSRYSDRFDRLQKRSDDKPSRFLAQQAVNQHLEHSYATRKEHIAKSDRNEFVQEKQYVDADSESESDIDEDFESYETLSGLSRVQDFIVSSTAFSRFREDLRGFVRQDFMSKVNSLIRKLTKDARGDLGLERSASKLNRLARELALIPPNQIWLLFEERLGLLNQSKIIIEDLTQQTWDWWPWKPCRRSLFAGHARLFWNCVSSAPTVLKILLTTTSHVVRSDGKMFLSLLQQDLANS
jgi:tetratricopeptide (TPR) repeat protein